MTAVVLLVLATGLCLFDQDEQGAGGHVGPLDLCLGMVAVSLPVMPLAGLLAVGWAFNLPVLAARGVAIRVPHPPPKTASFL